MSSSSSSSGIPAPAAAGHSSNKVLLTHEIPAAPTIQMQASALADLKGRLQRGPNGTPGDALMRACVYQQWDNAPTWVDDVDFCKSPDARGMLPLHLTVSHNAPVHIVRALLRTFGGGAAHADVDGATALHHAAAKQASVDVVGVLLEANPAAASRACTLMTSAVNGSVTGGGFTPLHWAFVHSVPGVPELLLGTAEGKQSARVLSHSGQTPLHVGAAHGAATAALQLAIEAYPEALHTPDQMRALPLHHAIATGAPLDAVRCIAEAGPLAAKATTVGGANALHLAAGHQATAKATAAATTSATAPTVAPITEEEQHRHVVEVIKLLVELWPQGLKETEERGRSPLHVACVTRAPACVVDTLINHRWVGAAVAREQDAMGSTALHLAAATKGTSLQVVELLLRAWDGAPVCRERAVFILESVHTD
eukprot:COSAG01_NODE_3128_length_6541_cov_14.744334_4_plen_425_part_00